MYTAAGGRRAGQIRIQRQRHGYAEGDHIAAAHQRFHALHLLIRGETRGKESHNMRMGQQRSRVAVSVEPFHGSRSELLPLFAQADDSAAEINSYIGLGEVLVARRARRIVGHVQLIAAAPIGRSSPSP